MPATPTFAFSRSAKTNRLVLVLLSVGFAALFAAIIAVVMVQQQVEEDTFWVEHTLDVETSLNKFIRHAERTETARRGVLLTRGASSFVKIAERGIADTRAELEILEARLRDNPRQIAALGILREKLDRYEALVRRSMDDARRGKIVREDLNTDPTVVLMREIRVDSDAMIAREGTLLRERNDQQEQTRRLLYAMLALCGLLIVTVSIGAVLLIRRNIREIDASRRELHDLNQQLENLVDERTAELQRANAEIQRFAYIVSHDLRSPLVNVMGFTAELDAARKTISDHMLSADTESLPKAVRFAVEEDLPEAIGFIRSSTQKMDRLINAILRLSREGRRTIAPVDIDLGELVRGVADSLRHRIDETGTTLTIGALPRIESDRLAIEQILSNLIENALKYLQPGRPGEIRVEGREIHGRAVITVRDNGRGIDPRDHERIFDLFRRSGQQDQPGEGIGLAHVRALAYRLGGLVEVSSATGEGSTFTVSLPLRFQAGESDV